jgi:hypothetical protein
MIEENLAVVSTVRELICKNQLATKGNVASKFMPLRSSDLVRLLECLNDDSRLSDANKLAQNQRKHTLFNDVILLSSFSAACKLAFALLTSMVISSTVAPCLVWMSHEWCKKCSTHVLSLSLRAA